jgi:hypothetical protein
VTERFAEGSTWTIPAYVGPNYIRMAEMGTPVLKRFYYTYTEPKQVKLAAGETVKLGAYTLEVLSADAGSTSVSVALLDASGTVVASKTLGSVKELWDVLPQQQVAVKKLQLLHGDVMAEIDIDKPVGGRQGRPVLFTDILESEMDQKLAWDSRFTIRPDVVRPLLPAERNPSRQFRTLNLDRDNPTYDGPPRRTGRPCSASSSTASTAR